jgi:GTP-binding protein
LIEGLAPRQSLRGLMLVVDARRGILPGDQQLMDWAQRIGQPVHVLFSKCDQLKRAESQKLLQQTLPLLQGRGSAQLFSAHTGVGLQQARAQLDAWLI